MNSGDASIAWNPKPHQNAKALRLFWEGMDDMHGALAMLSRGSVGGMRIVGRKVSVELRKLLFDGVPLVHRVLHRPRFHPLFNYESLAGDVYENESSLRIAPGTRGGPLSGMVATQTWRIVVHPLHGLKFNRTEKKWIFGPLFDTRAQRMALEPWSKQRQFKVDGREYSLLDTLKFIANKEAVHVDIGRDVSARDMERVHFGHTTYPHIVAIMVASYLLEQYRTSCRIEEKKWGSFLGLRDRGGTDYELIGGGEFSGVDIEPMGFDGEFHETGIQVPEPGRVWNPVQIEEEVMVQA